MTRTTRLLAALVLCAAVGFLGFRVLVANDARVDGSDPREALRVAPLEGAPFVALAAAPDPPATPLAMHQIVSRRAPRNLLSRAWLADYHLRANRHAQALDQLDVILRLSPVAGREIFPLMVQWAGDPAFARALVARLRADPEWRAAMLGALSAKVASPEASAVFAALREAGDLEEVEVRRWLEALMRAGHWGRAYAHWVGSLDLPPGEALPMLHDGGFERPMADQAFGWRIGDASGTYTEIGPAPGATGQAAHLVFLGRPVSVANLEQPLLLPPGAYRLRMRLMAQALHSDQGLEWSMTCDRQPRPFATGDRIEGNFEWREVSFDFVVPDGGCPGQWLRLRNPAPKGSASKVSGDLWVDDLTLGAAPADA